MAPRKPTSESGAPVDEKTGEILDQAKAILDVDVVFNEMSLAAKLAWVMQHMPELKPEGRNSFHKYDFIKDVQVSGAVRSLFSRCGIAVIVRQIRDHQILERKTSKDGTSYLTQLIVGYRLINAHDPADFLDGEGIGYGDDAGDKGANKAMTSAMKYWLMKTLQIGGEDLEDDASTDARAAERSEAPRRDKPVKVEDSAIEGIQRGGRSDAITEAQIREVGGLMRTNGMNAVDGIEFLARIHGLEPGEIDPAVAGAKLREMLTSMTAEAAGELIQRLDALSKEVADEAAHTREEDDAWPSGDGDINKAGD